MKIAIIGDYGFSHKEFDTQLAAKLDILKQVGLKDLSVFSPQPYIADLCKLDRLEQSFHFVFPLEDRDNTELLLETALRLYYASLDYTNRRDKLRPNEQKALDILNDVDVLWVSTAGIIDVKMFYNLLILLLPCLLAKNLNTKVVISGQGFAPLSDYNLTPFLTYILNQCDQIFTRDRYKQGLDNINVDLSKVIFTQEEVVHSFAINYLVELANPKCDHEHKGE